MIDWTVARTLATTVSGNPPEAELPGLEAAAAESERLVTDYTGLSSAGPLPVAEPVDRAAWIDANLDAMQAVLDPVVEQATDSLGPLKGPAGGVLGLVLGAEVGVLSGLLAQRVLGQYEFGLLAPDPVDARLLFVAPNLAEAASAMDADPDDLLRWVALHETTHALQFGGVPWLREHLAGLVQELLSSVRLNPGGLTKLPDLTDLQRLIDTVREGGIAALMVTAEQREALDRIQATMAVLEGHAEHVMDAVGEEILPNIGELRDSLERRRDTRPPLWRILEKLLGLDLKMRQYRQGKQFCDAVVEKGGIAGLNQVWSGPEAMPSLLELEAPEAWLERVLRSAA
jgi:coenzyme F420 biosynthesis associated uncharacterized protein